MAPTDTTLPTPITATIPTRTDDLMRTRIRRRREPNPLDQLPAWRDLVPVMDPAVIGGAPAGQ
jgi:hypothetical protein